MSSRSSLTKYILSTLFLVANTLAAPVIWNGTADVSWYTGDAQAYNLTTAEELAGLAKLVNEGTSSFEGKTITLGADIFLNDTTGYASGTWASVPRTSWIPIGTSANPFKGEFDGLAGRKNRVIYGVYINEPTSDGQGLFGYTSNVNVKNLDILAGRIVARNDVGTIIGRAASGSVTNVNCNVMVSGQNHVGGIVGYSTGSITKASAQENIAGQDSVGGMAGYISGTISGAASARTYFKGNVSGRSFVGGLAGRSGMISQAYTEGVVSGTRHYVGGVVGYSDGAIDATYHTKGTVKGDSNYVGGIAGYSVGRLLDVYSTEVVRGKNYTGGVVGYAAENVQNANSTNEVNGGDYTGGVAGYVKGSVIDAYSMGKVSGISYTGGVVGYAAENVQNANSANEVNGGDYTGGVAGYVYGYIRNAHAEKSVHGGNYTGGVVGRINGTTDVAYFTGDSVVGVYRVGGLIGLGAAVDSSYAVTHVYATDVDVGGLMGNGGGVSFSHFEGTVKSKNGAVGGLVGYNANGNINDSYAIAKVSGKDRVGGLVGELRKEIYRSYAEGDVDGSSDNVGGVVGYLVGKGDSLYHKGVVSSTGSYVGGVVGKSDNVLTNASAEGDVSGANYVGGLVGYVGTTTLNGTYHGNTKTALSVRKSYSMGVVTGAEHVGGLAGFAYGGLDSTYHIKGNVTGTKYVGGLVGEASATPSYNRIFDSYAVCDVVGTKSYVGGIAGYSRDMDGVYHIGEVSSDSSYVGGIVGYTVGWINHSYSEGDVSGYDQVGGAIGFGESSVLGSHAQGNQVSGGYRVGGLAGGLNGSVDSAYAQFDVNGSKDVGGLVGWSHSSISNSYSKGAVVGLETWIGGLVGSIDGDVNNSSFIGSVRGMGHVGGLVGDTRAAIYGSSAKADVTASSNSVGGLAGYVKYYVGTSMAEGRVSGVDSVGGLAGYVGGWMRGSSARGVVAGRNTVGGAAGYVGGAVDVVHYDGDSVTGIFQIGGLAGYARGSVDSSYSRANVKGDDNVGGLIGSAYADVTYSYATGNVMGDVDNSSAGNDNLGGLVGYMYSGSISKSFAVGDVEGVTKVGGLVGRFEGTEISQSYANGNVVGRFEGDPADLNGNFYIGGLVGLGKGTLLEVYSSGKVTGSEEDPFYTGCMVGASSATMSISKSYYDVSACKTLLVTGDEDGFVTVSGSPAQNTAAMQVQETFEDWDFDDTWTIFENTYPFLRIFTNSMTNAVVTTTSLENFVYDGTPKTPLVTSVTLFGKTLAWEMDYTITYVNNVDVGVATLKICGLAPYAGCKDVEYEITGTKIQPVIAEIANVTYTGLELKPAISVYDGETLLTEKDYSVSYSNNVYAGTGSVTVKMKGNYSGTATQTFVIEKAESVIRSIPTASSVINGQTLASSELVGGSANVSGSFAWVKPNTVPSIENEGYAVVFIPADTNYVASAETIVPVKVLDMVYVVVHAGAETVDSVIVVKGSSYTLPEVPERIGYDFVGLYNGDVEVGVAGESVTIVSNTTITAAYQTKKYTITFKNGTTNLQSGLVDYDATPIYKGTTPVKASSVKFDYSFAGWTPEIVAVSGAASYTAVFDSTIRSYTVSFMNGSEQIQASPVLYGSVPVYEGTAPVKASTAQYRYVFAGWSPDVAAVIGDITYMAIFDSVVRKYLVVFMDGLDTLQVDSVAYGSAPKYSGKTPVQTSTDGYDYEFTGWDHELSAVTGEDVYYAVYNNALRSYAITFKNEGVLLQSSLVEYGELPKYEGKTPVKASSVVYDYAFKGWDSKIVSVTGVKTYNAVFDSTLRSYEVTFVNGSKTMQTGAVEYGSLPIYEGAVPTKTATEQYTYSFSGWTPEIKNVTGAATYSAQFDSTVNEYVVSFSNGNEVLQTGKIAYGALPKYSGETPEKASSVKYDYTFAGWTPQVKSVAGNANYQAVFDSTLRSYRITFESEDAVLSTVVAKYGTKPVYDGLAPTKASTEKYAYTFAGWTPEITNVTGDASYSAVFAEGLRRYEIYFVSAGKIILTDSVEYGATPVYEGAEPTKTSTAGYTYSFKGWNKAFGVVKESATYTAVFDSTLRSYTVSFYNGSTRLQTGTLNYGEMPEYVGEAPKKSRTVAYSYTFRGWNRTISTVTGDVSYMAVFDSTKRTYEIAFVNEAVRVLQRVEYGATPKYEGTTPVRSETPTHTFTFLGWSPKIAPVTGDMEYTAVFDSTRKEYIVWFRNGDKTLQMSSVPSGDSAKYIGETPTKKTINRYAYKFAGWSPEVGIITEPTVYTAVFDTIDLWQDALPEQNIPVLSIGVSGKQILLSGVMGDVPVILLDLRGNVIFQGRAISEYMELVVPNAGSYILKIGDLVKRLNVR